MATDQLAALTIWDFEMLRANEIPLRRCAYYGCYFRPYSVVNYYCDCVVEGTNGKTCKQVGTTSKQQQAVNQNAAKKAVPDGVQPDTEYRPPPNGGRISTLILCAGTMRCSCAEKSLWSKWMQGPSPLSSFGKNLTDPHPSCWG